MNKEKIILLISLLVAITLLSLGGYGYLASKNIDNNAQINTDDKPFVDNDITSIKEKIKTPPPTETPPIIPETPPVTPTPVAKKWKSYAGAWLEVGELNSKKEYSDGRVMDVLAPNYFDVNSEGDLVKLIVIEDGVNAYSASNATDIKAHSRHQYITISGNYQENINALVSNPTKITAFKNTTKAMLDSIGFTGLDIDFEDSWEWSNTDYVNFKNFLTDLGNFLHSYGYKLQVDLPAFIDADDEAATPIRYTDFNTLPVDRIVIMTYDNDIALGAGHAISPFKWIQDTCDYLLPKITDHRRIVMGIPSYAYKGLIGSSNDIRNQTKLEALAEPNASTAIRDTNSGEMKWTYNGKAHFYNDTYSMNAKRTIIEAEGITNVMVWVLGDTDWFTGSEL